ncbi:glutamate-5-semialdehyde dehydrogenase [Fangia hongkongensis]|uniref:glutamate-5-semialdehyde dehydrogenase n=1 Tax=Fangia hongkongensis TaxID=270495 RepID=UPI000380E3A0|nr:glutamate-5-semialdehyde dehydrogenase [Fangia hongkongensis]MBK2125166.1 glutamate-5-semialdehyde dehydrogenase [Fangia hongkongensis]
MSSANMEYEIKQLAANAKKSAHQLAMTTNEQRNHALQLIAQRLVHEKLAILKANQNDLDQAREKGLSPSMIDRLKLDDKRIDAMADGLLEIAKQEDPLGRTLWQSVRPTGLDIRSISVPLGVIAVIYEARPNVTVDAAGLCLKSGNSVVLRGGSEAKYSNRMIVEIIHHALEQSDISPDVIQFVNTQERDAIKLLVSQSDSIDVVVPRGGKGLINYLTEHSKIPLFKHLDGICHTYIHKEADAKKALDVSLNAKMRRTSICGATETILVDRALSKTILPKLLNLLASAGCEVKIDPMLEGEYRDYPLANDEDWGREYLDSIVSVKLTEDIDHAVQHINHYGSHHTDSIITENLKMAEYFMRSVDSAVVMHNTSTQFSDGGEFGMGAEIGIATGKLHARGPVGINQLTTFKYYVVSDGATRK